MLLITFDTAETKPMLSVAEIFTKIMTKQEKIQEAYGKYWEVVYEYVDKNGWCSAYWKTKTYFQTEFTSEKWRPKSLTGIEDNNGWIKIESKQNEEQYFNEKREMFVLTENGDIFIFNHYKYLSNVGKITHFKPIENPKPPIY